EFTAIMGPSGSGKSTLMHIMAGLDSPSSGGVWLGDTEIGGLGDEQLTLLRRRRIGFVFQALHPVPTHEVDGNLPFAFELDRPAPHPPPARALRRAAAARGDRPRPGHAPRARVRRRAHRQP